MGDTRTPLSELLASMARDGDRSRVVIPADWLQGRAIYGGLSAALCLQATYDQLGSDLPPLRSVQTTFIGPTGPEVSVQATVVRRGKSTAFVTTDLCDSDDNIAVRATFCFGKARESRVDHRAIAAPEVAAPDDCPVFFEQAGPLAPSFTRHFDSRFAGGAVPASGAEQPEFNVWLRHRDAAIETPVVALAALADALPPAAMACFSEPAPVSSMTWFFDLLSDDPQTEQGWWLSRSVCELARDGYSSQAMTIWNRAGAPIIVGRQNVAIFH